MQKITFTFIFFLLSVSLFGQLDGVNIALNKEAWSSSEENSSMAATYAFDGNYGSRWASAWTDDESISVDLESRYGIDTLIFFWQSSSSKAAEANILGSYDGNHWFEMAHFVKDHDLLSDTIVLEDTARYIKMQGIDRSNVYGYSIYELEVYAYAEITALYVDSIAVTPDESDLEFGESVTLSVAGFDQNEDAIAVGEVAWSVDNGGTIDQNGVFTANKMGDFKVTAIANNISDTALISVSSVDPIPTTLVLTPETDTIYELETTAFAAVVYDQNGNVLSETVEFETAINPIDASGVFTGTYTGSHKVTASLSFQVGDVEAILSDEATVAVYPNSTVNIAADYEAVDAESALTPAWMAVDGNVGTRWESAHGVDGVAWVVKLDTVYDLGAAKITWQNARAQSYTIDISNDSTSWETIYHFNPDDTTRTSGATTIDSLPIFGSAQYVRVYGISRITQWGYSFWEFELFEAANSTTELATIDLTPATATIDEGEELQLTAQGYDALANAIDVEIVWNVVEDGASVSDAGLFVSNIAGIYTVSATSGDVSSTATITVSDISYLDEIVVSPSSVVIPEGGSQTFEAVGYDQFGEEFAITPVWSANGGTIDAATGVFTHDVAGDYIVTATSGSITGTADVNVSDVPELASIVISPDTASIAVGGTQQFTAECFDQFGDAFTATLTWSADGGTIDAATGLYTATVTGEYNITATSGSISSSVDISVSEMPTITRIAVSPATAAIADNETQQLEAVAYDQFDNEITVTFAWTATSGTVDASGLFTPAAAGEVTVTAISGTVEGTAVITVSETPVLTTIEITPDAVTLKTGETQEFAAVAYDQNSDVVDAGISWAVIGSGSVTTEGVYTAGAVGNDTITATSGDVSAYVAIVVEAANSIRMGNISEVNVYPNPTTDWLTIDFEGKSYTAVDIVDINGSTVYSNTIASDNAHTVDLSAFEAGSYFVLLRSKNNTVSYKVVKK